MYQTATAGGASVYAEATSGAVSGRLSTFFAVLTLAVLTYVQSSILPLQVLPPSTRLLPLLFSPSPVPRALS